MESIYDPDFWVLKIDPDAADEARVSIPEPILETTKEKYVPGKYVLLYTELRKVRANGKPAGQRGVKLWLRKSFRPSAKGNELWVSRELLWSLNVDLMAHDFDPDSKSAKVAEVTLIKRSNWRYLLYWVFGTKAGRVETAKLALGVAAGILGAAVTQQTQSNGVDAAFIIGLLGLAVTLQAAFAFYEKLGKPD